MVLRLEERQRLARFGEFGADATGHRLRAARFVAGVSQLQLSRWRGWYENNPLAHIEAAEAGLVLPNYALASFYWHRLKLTSDFFDGGQVVEIPVEVEDRLFAALKAELDDAKGGGHSGARSK